jgi:hypothetical protein
MMKAEVVSKDMGVKKNGAKMGHGRKYSPTQLNFPNCVLE